MLDRAILLFHGFKRESFWIRARPGSEVNMLELLKEVAKELNTRYRELVLAKPAMTTFIHEPRLEVGSRVGEDGHEKTLEAVKDAIQRRGLTVDAFFAEAPTQMTTRKEWQ